MHGDLRSCLTEAADQERVVRVRRGIRRADKLEGYVVGIGRRWFLLHLLSPDIFLNGYSALRIADVNQVKDLGGTESFPARALALAGEKPRRLPEVELSSARTLLATAGAISPVVSIHTERIEPDVCYVGRPLSATKRLRLLEVTPQATWESAPSRWAYNDITRVDFGGRYEQALHEVAGPPPSEG
jgi:hypothetical protein